MRILGNIIAGLLIALGFVITLGAMMTFVGLCILSVIGLTVMSFVATG